MKRSLTAAVVMFSLAFGAPRQAEALVVNELSTYDFTGTCADCNGIDKAELTLSNYSLGQAIDQFNFVSFHFDGSNLYDAFTITQPNQIIGQFNPPLPAAEHFLVSDSSNFIFTAQDGSWILGSSAIIADFGTNGTWSLESGATLVPEPISLVLLCTSLVGTATLRRRNA